MGDYSSDSKTEVASGTLEHKGKAEQTAGIYKLGSSSTVKASGPRSELDIYGGGIIGGGTVNGNLVLGYSIPLGQSLNPAISPTLADGGTLTIIGNFTSSSDSYASFMSDSKGNYTKLVVGGEANMNGTLDFRVHNSWWVPTNTIFSLITAGSIAQHFQHRIIFMNCDI